MQHAQDSVSSEGTEYRPNSKPERSHDIPPDDDDSWFFKLTEV
jgi:hypothetical protein